MANPPSLPSLIEQGDLDALRRQPPELLRQWRSQKHGNSLLHQAARHGPQALLPLLASLGLDVSERNRLGETPIMCIFERPSDQVRPWMEALIAHGARVEVHDATGRSFVSQCVHHHQWAVLKQAIEHGARRHTPNAPWTGSAEYPLYRRLRERRITEIHLRQWLERLDGIMPPTEDDITRSFMLAVRHGAVGCAQRLRQGGARIDKVDDRQNNVLHLVAGRAKYNEAMEPAYFQFVRDAVAAKMSMAAENDDKKTPWQILNSTGGSHNLPAFQRALAEGEAGALEVSVPRIAGSGARARRI